jgi:hypothetical protein
MQLPMYAITRTFSSASWVPEEKEKKKKEKRKSQSSPHFIHHKPERTCLEIQQGNPEVSPHTLSLSKPPPDSVTSMHLVASIVASFCALLCPL